MQGPSSWRIVPEGRSIELSPHEHKRIAFSIEKGVNISANRYPMEVSAVSAGGERTTRRQIVACASAPYFNPEIDGRKKEWEDAIPVRFMDKGKTTTISTYWTRRKMSFCIEVEEETLSGIESQKKGTCPDAVQIAMAPSGGSTSEAVKQDSNRYEFLLVASEEQGKGLCFQLASPGEELKSLQEKRNLMPLLYEDAEVSVTREDNVTLYECSLPFRQMRRRIRPTEGRSFFLSFLVHDPDGTGIRDWGEAAGLAPSERNPLAWSSWEGVQWGEMPPFDNTLYWGLCSSKH